MTGYWDIHNHILPGVDDGSGCMSETMEMLEEEYRQGVRHIVFTPHYRRDMFAIPREEIQTVYARVCEMAADRFPEMEFYLGCEYYIHSDASVERLRGNPKYYMAGSRTVLMEFAYEASYAWIMQTVSEVRQMGLQPVVAHAERYECLYKGRDRVAELKTQGAYIQINCESILGKCGRKAKHFCMKLLKEDPKELYAFAQKSGRRIGIVYESHYHLMVVDVVRAKNGSLFAYERLMNRVMRGAVVIVPYYNGKYILLRQYRHALREYQYGFPRGFGEEGISAKENAGKELWEELGVQAEKWKSFGKIVPDSGAMSSKADVFLAELNEAPQVIQEEEIVGHIALDWEQLGEWIRDGKITDGFTLAAYAKMSLQK
ncbi:MAG: CpsB/CapC family capsule biosynthesis tyrosine phosphatase [Eubacterium ramulus]|nr:CpsB/CapC family capsule biosynthesis tyrosine phosphatase [Eubacterium ramulus]